MPSYDYIKRNQKGWEKAPSIKRLQQKHAKSSWIPTVVQKAGIWRLTLAVPVWERRWTHEGPWALLVKCLARLVSSMAREDLVSKIKGESD